MKILSENFYMSSIFRKFPSATYENEPLDGRAAKIRFRADRFLC